MPEQGGLPPLARESCSPEVARLALLSLFFFSCAHQCGNSQPAHLSRDIMAAVRASRTSSLLGRHHPAGIHPPPAGFQPYVQPRRHPAHPKQASRFEGFPTRAHVLCPSVTCFVRSTNRTHSAGHMELYTHARLENPSVPNSFPCLTSVRLRGRLESTAAFPDRVSLAQTCVWRPRAKHGTNHALAAV